MHQYRIICKKGEGTFSEVLKAQKVDTQQYVAIKCMKSKYDSIAQVNKLREVQALRKLSNFDNLIKLYEVLFDEQSGKLALVFELMDQNLYEYIKNRKKPLSPQRVKQIIYLVLKSLDHMHKNGIFHRDIKPENILVLGENEVKLADLGSCKGFNSKYPYTEYISTRWYRSPECLLTDGYYDYKMDIWGVGCVFFEIMALFPLFPGKNELDQIHKIHNIIGTPQQKLIDKYKKHATHMELNFPQRIGTGIDKLIPAVHASKECIDILKQLLKYDPDERITASQALKHSYFREFYERDQKTDFQNSLITISYSPSSSSGKVEQIKNTYATKMVPKKNNHQKINLTFKSQESEDHNDSNTSEIFLPPIKNSFIDAQIVPKFQTLQKPNKSGAVSKLNPNINYFKSKNQNLYINKRIIQNAPNFYVKDVDYNTMKIESMSMIKKQYQSKNINILDNHIF